MIAFNTIEEDFKKIEEFTKEISFFVNSDLRLDILINLFNTPSTIKQLHENTQLNYTSISTNLNKLEKIQSIKKDKDTYSLKNDTKFKLLNLIFLENNLVFLNKFKNFLNHHSVRNNNLVLLDTLPFVRNVKLIQADNINPDLATETIEETMTRSGKVKSVCIYLHPNCSDMIEYMVNNNADFEVIVPLYLSEYILNHATEYKTDKPLKCKRFNVKPIIDYDLKVALVVSPNKMVIGLTRQEGLFNKSCCLETNESVAIDWGYNFFKEYEN